MRHRKDSRKLGRSSAHRSALLSHLVCALINEGRIKTTVSKAKEARRLAEKMVTLGRKQSISSARNVAARRLAVARLHKRDCVKKLFDEVVPQMEGRAGGYTRMIKLGRRRSDSSEMVLLEWVEPQVADVATETVAAEA
jgi:large subunit ribosomal protein L17